MPPPGPAIAARNRRSDVAAAAHPPVCAGSRAGLEGGPRRSAGASLAAVGGAIAGRGRGRGIARNRTLSPPPQVAQLNLEINLKEPAPIRSPSFLAYCSNDAAGDGVTDLDGFMRWQHKLLEASSKSGPEKRQRLAWLVSELNKLDVAQGRSHFWRRRHAAVNAFSADTDAACELARSGDTIAAMRRVAAGLRQLHVIVDQEHGAGRASSAAEKGRQMMVELKVQWVSEFDAALEEECTSCAAVETMLKEVAVILPEEELAPQVERFEQMRKPFKLKVATLAGAEVNVEVSRVNTVCEVKNQLAVELDVLPYRLELSRDGGEMLIDAKTLEEHGIYGEGVHLFVVFRKVDKFREMSHADFVELIVAKRLDSRANISKPLPAGTDEMAFRQPYIPRLVEIDEEEERRRQRLEQRQRHRESILAEASKLIATNGDAGAVAQVVSRAQAAEREVQQRVQECMAIKEDAERDLDAALPALDHAVRSLNRLSKADLCEVGSFANPPPLVLVVCEAVCILFEEKTTWARAKHLLHDSMLLYKMLEYDKDNVSPSVIARLEPYIARHDFHPDAVGRCSVAAAGFCSWVRAMHTYDRIAKEVRPKRDALRVAEEALEDASAESSCWQDALQQLATTTGGAAPL